MPHEDKNIIQDTTSKSPDSSELDGQKKCLVKQCCKITIEEHVTHNKMMVCDTCKMLIKCYQEKRRFDNYLKFCESRNRTTFTGFFAGHYTIVFNPYSH